MARSRHPGAEARAFMVSDSPTQAAFSARARMARLPCRASAMPSAAKISAPTSGMPASRAATTGLCLTRPTMTYWASQLTAAAAAASTASAIIALRSQARPLSRLGSPPLSLRLTTLTVPGSASSKSSFFRPNGSHLALTVTATLLLRARQPGELAAEVFGCGQGGVQHLVKDVADAPAGQEGELAQPRVDAGGDPGGQPGAVGLSHEPPSWQNAD